MSSLGPADEFEKFRQQNAIKKQKLDSDASAALARSRQLEGTDPAAARDLLRRVLIQVEDASFMPERQRFALEQQLRQRILQVNQRMRDQEAAAALKAQQAADKLRKEIRPSGQPPVDSPAAYAKDRIGAAKSQEEYAAKVRALRENGFLNVQRDIDLAASTKEQWITERFVWATAQRAEKLTKEEKAALKALNSVMTPDFDQVSLKDILETIMEKTDVAILVDENALKDAGVDYQADKITFKLKTKVSVRTILRKLLGEKSMSYIIKDGTIQVMSLTRAREMMVTRMYPVRDLVMPDPRMGPFFGQMMLQQNVNALIQLIQNSVDPDIWRGGQPGGAAISFDPVSMSLAVRAPAELHYMMGFSGSRR